MRRVSISTLVGALVLGILATWLGPKMITYWYAPPVVKPYNCTEEVTWAMHRLVSTQIIGTLAGAVIGVVIGILLSRRKPEAAAAAPAPAPPAK
jgi:uncharacterized membrane protein YjjB (DUF3815 family)